MAIRSNPLVSIIIPTHKGANVDKLVDSINNSNYKNIEIIVVDEGLERSAQRNIGRDRAKGEYLFIPDSDWVVTPGLIEECVDKMALYDAIYIPETIKTRGLFAKIRNWERQFFTATAIDAVRFVRADGCPRFDETMTGPEDSDWDRRIKGIKVVSRNCYYHYDNVSFLSFFEKKAYYAKSMSRFIEKWPNDKVLDFKYRCWTVFTENGKWKRCVENPFMTLAVMFIIFLRGIIYLTRR